MDEWTGSRPGPVGSGSPPDEDGPTTPPGWSPPWPETPTPPAPTEPPVAPPANPYGWPAPGPFQPGAFPPGAYPPGGGYPPPGGAWHWGPAGGGGFPGGPPPGYRGTSRALVAAVVAVGVLVAALLGGVVGHDLWQQSNAQPFAGLNPGTGNNPSTSTGSGAPANASAIAAAISPCLVDVNTQITAAGVEGAGTGMVLTSNGTILTNNHVIESANRISVTDIGNGKVYDANVVGYDRTQDVAVLQLVNASGLQTCPIGDSSKVNVGDGVVAVGNAGGQGGTPSAAGGSVTGLNQTITASDEVDGSSEQLTGLIQTNAGIVAGDSGGPLVSTEGRIVGMNTAASGGFQFSSSGTQGYSIPINLATSIARQITSGNASATIHIGPTAFLGVGVRAPSSVFGGASGTPGAQIVQLVPGGPADQSGLVVGDVITNLDGHAVTSPQGLTSVMINEKPGNSVSLTYLDTSGQQHTIRVVLGSGPAQ